MSSVIQYSSSVFVLQNETESSTKGYLASRISAETRGEKFLGLANFRVTP